VKRDKPRKPREETPITGKTAEVLARAQRKMQQVVTGREVYATGVKDPSTKSVHPLAVGLREAKMEIARILHNAENRKMLAAKLQCDFEENPSEFLLRFEPLLRRYEESTPEEGQRLPIRILMDKVQINIDQRKEGPGVEESVTIDAPAKVLYPGTTEKGPEG